MVKLFLNIWDETAASLFLPNMVIKNPTKRIKKHSSG